MLKTIFILNLSVFVFFNVYKSVLNLDQYYNKNMDPQQQIKEKSIENDLSLLMPRRANKKEDSFKNTKTVSFYTNYYDIAITERKTKIYQYSFSLPQAIPKDSGIYNLALNSIKQQLRKKIGLITYSGQILWGINPIKTAATFACQFKVGQETYKHEAFVDLVKQFSLFQLDAYQTRQSYTHILNSYLKNTFKTLKYTQLGRNGQYYINKSIQDLMKDKSQNKLSQDGLCVLQGFRANLTQLNSGLFLQLDVCSRVLQTQNLLRDFDNKGSEFIKQNFTGKIVTTKYGTLRTYQILDIDNSKTPKSTFIKDKGDQITFQKYYKQKYGLIVTNYKQPLLIVVKSTKKVLQKNKKQMKQVKQYAYLLPQFVSLAGLRQNQRQDKHIMGNLSKFTKLTPKTRVQQCQKIINQINKCQSIIEVGHQKKFEGYQLGLPFLAFSPKEKGIQPSWKGIWNERITLKQPYYFENWLVVFSIKKETQDSCRMEANKTVNLFKTASKAYGIKFNDPTFLQIKSSSVSVWQQKIQKELERNRDIKIVVVLLQDWQDKHYSNLKRLLTNGLEIPVPSQFIKISSLKTKNAISIASKIIIQMNTKVGASPWKVQRHHPYFKDKKLMYGSLSISKGEKGYTLAFVGTGKDDCTQFYSQCQTGLKSKQDIPVQKLSKIFINWAKNYFLTNNRTNSDLIILYLQGLSIPQTQQKLQNLLIPALQLTRQKVGHSTNSKFDPQIMIITVNKKVKSRFYEKLQNGSIQNVEAGSVIIEPLSQERSYDFHMAAQYVSQGTCNPTVFRVAYDKTNMPQQALINFTFEQCFNYYNWQGAVRVPACLQNANKLSKLVSMHIKENISISELCKKQFFL